MQDERNFPIGLRARLKLPGAVVQMIKGSEHLMAILI